MRVLLALTLFACLVLNTAAFYTKKDDVVELTAKDFKEKVVDGTDAWLVEFYAPWCGHCKNLVPEYKKLGKKLKDVEGAKVGAVDATKHESLGPKYGVKGFPTIKLFLGNGNNKPIDYNGARTADAMADFVKREIKARAGKSDKSDKSDKKSKKSEKKSKKSANAVVELTESTFEELVMESDDLWLVEFFAPWCGHCKSLAPHWESAAKELSGTAKLGAVDATVYTNLASKYDVQGYPTIKVFKPGKKSSPEDYQGGRTSSDIVLFTKNLASIVTPAKPKTINQLINQDVFDETCGETTCLIAFLPHILDTQASGREAYLNTLKEVATSNVRKPFSYAWLELGSQPELEQALTSEFGGIAFPPAIVAVNIKKGRHVMMTGPFNAEGINRFIGGVISGAERTVPLQRTELSVASVEAWDGKDAQLPRDDEL